MSSQDDNALTSKISLYSDQLAQVNSILATDPTNDQYIKIRDDLLKVIHLTSDLLKYQHSNTGDTDFDTTTRNQENEITKEIEADLDSNDDEGDNNLDDEDDDELETEYTGVIQPGEIVEVLGGDRPYAGIVKGILSPTEYRVKYFEFETEVTLPLASLNRISKGTLSKDEVYVGMKGQCKFSQDQLYYDCTIQEITEYGAIVLYTQYGNSEEVPLAYIRPLIQKQKKEDKDKSVIKIPEHLKILPTDTEEEKQRKKKKIKAIKNRNRLITKEQEVAAVQNNWQKFVKKTSKKALSGGLTKSSIFTSPEAVDGKVGVINSGKGLTEFIPRKKHKF